MIEINDIFFLSPKLIFNKHLQREPFLFAVYAFILAVLSLKNGSDWGKVSA